MANVHKDLPGELNCLAHMLSHIGDILTAMGKHGDGKLTPAEASSILRSESEDKGYLAYLEQAADEVSSGVYAMEAMKVINTKVMSLFTYHTAQHTMGAAVNMTSLHSYHGQREVVCDATYKEPPGFEVRHLNLSEAEVQEMVRAYQNDISTFHKVDLKSVYAVATGHDIQPGHAALG